MELLDPPGAGLQEDGEEGAGGGEPPSASPRPAAPPRRRGCGGPRGRPAARPASGFPGPARAGTGAGRLGRDRAGRPGSGRPRTCWGEGRWDRRRRWRGRRRFPPARRPSVARSASDPTANAAAAAGARGEWGSDAPPRQDLLQYGVRHRFRAGLRSRRVVGVGLYNITLLVVYYVSPDPSGPSRLLSTASSARLLRRRGGGVRGDEGG